MYGSLSGIRRGSRRPSPTQYQRQAAALSAQLNAQQRIATARHLADSFQAILQLHRQVFPSAQRPVASPPPPVDQAAIRKHHLQQQLRGVGLFNRAERKKRRHAAEQVALWEVTERSQRLEQQRHDWQCSLDEGWARLCANDPNAVLPTLEDAFADNEAPAVAVAVDGGEVSLVVLVPGVEAVPDSWPSVTAANNISLRRLGKRERADYHTIMVCGHVLATIREAFAVAPGLVAARVVALRVGAIDAYGRPRLECLMLGRTTRAALAPVLWDQVDAVAIVNDTFTDRRIVQDGRTRELHALDLAAEPDVAALIGQIDLSSLTRPTRFGHGS